MFRAVEVASWCQGGWQGKVPERVARFCHDTRWLQAGDCYIALAGEQADGHAYLAEAQQKGAVAAVVRHDYLPTTGVDLPLLRVADPRQALWHLAAAYRRTMGGLIVAITGSLGKTTVKEMTADILMRGGVVGRTKGNWNTDIGLPLSMLAVPSNVDFGVFEVGMNHPGELAPLCSLLQPDISVVTKISSVHLEYFPSVAAIAEEKAEVLRCLSPKGVAILSQDDPYFQQLLSHCHSRLVTVSMRPKAAADFVGEITGPTRDLEVTEKSTGERFRYNLPLLGDHLRYNALLAVAVGRACGVMPAAIGEALQNYHAPARRWCEVEFDGIKFIDDAYNAHPLSMQAALHTFAALPGSAAKWLVLGGMRELGQSEKDEHLALGREVSQGPWDGLVVVGQLGKLIADGALEAGMSSAKVYHCANNREVVQLLKSKLTPSVVVLLKGSRKEKLEEILQLW